MRCSYSFNPPITGDGAANFVNYNMGIKLTKQVLQPLSSQGCSTCSGTCVNTGSCPNPSVGTCATGCTSGGTFGSGLTSICGKPLIGKCSADFFVVYNGMPDTYPTMTTGTAILNLGAAPLVTPLTLGTLSTSSDLGLYYATNANGILGLLFQSGMYGGYGGTNPILGALRASIAMLCSSNPQNSVVT